MTNLRLKLKLYAQRRLHLFTSFALSFFLISCFQSKDHNSLKTVFTYNQAQGLTSLDPAFANNQANVWAVQQLYNGLVELNSDLEIKPSLAHKYTISDSGKKYVFQLRKDVFFHDHELFLDGKGRKVNASDFVYSFKRIIDSTSIYNKGSWVFNDKLLRDSNGMISDTCFVAKNDSTFVIYLNSSFPQFLSILTMPYAFVIPKEVSEHFGKDFREHPVGTGPYKFFVWSEGEALVMHKNERYFKNDQYAQRPDALKISFIPDKGQAFHEMNMGRLQFFSGIEESFRDEILTINGNIKAEALAKYNVEKMPYLNTAYIGIQMDSNAICYRNASKKSLLDLDFRKALAQAIDKPRLVKYMRNGLGIPGEYGIVPPIIPGYDTTKVLKTQFDPELARFYFRKSRANTSNSSELSLHIIGEHKALAEFLVKQWEDVLGIKIGIDVHETGMLREMSKTGEAELFIASWLGDYPDAENYLSLMFSENFTPNGPNKMHYKNNMCDSLFLYSSNLRGNDRNSILQRMDSLAMNDVPIFVLYYDEIIRITSKDVKHLESNAMNLLKVETVLYTK